MGMTEDEFMALPEGREVLTISFVLQPAARLAFGGVEGAGFYAVIDGVRQSVFLPDEVAVDLVHALNGRLPEDDAQEGSTADKYHRLRALLQELDDTGENLTPEPATGLFPNYIRGKSGVLARYDGEWKFKGEDEEPADD